jgi:hypothetical protein
MDMSRGRRADSDGSIRGKAISVDVKCMGCDQVFRPALQEALCRSCLDDMLARPDDWLDRLLRLQWSPARGHHGSSDNS